MHDLLSFHPFSRELPRDSQRTLLDSPDPLFDAFASEPPRRPGPPLSSRHSPSMRAARRQSIEARASGSHSSEHDLEPSDPPRPGAVERKRSQSSRQRGPARFGPFFALLFVAALSAAACGGEKPAPIARDAILVQLHGASRLPAWSRADEGGPSILPLDSLGPDEEPPLLRVPVPANSDPSAFAEELARDPEVAFAETVALQQPLARTPDDPRFKDLWGLAEIDAPSAWDTTVGSRAITVAVIDDGLALTHPDLAANLWVNPDELAGNGLDDDGDGIVDDVHGASFLDGVASGDPSPDPSGSAPWHGTHASGIIGAVGDNRAGVCGVNWRVSLMGVRAMSDGGGRSDDLAQAIDFASAHGARVINASWGGSASAAVTQAIARAGKRGALFVAAAGNDGAASPGFPANLELDNLLSVGALDVNGALASFSNRGALVAAPGVGILSTSAPGSYERADGTSVAAPHVSGLAALLFAAHQEASVEQVREAILSSAIATLGVQRGRIDAARALAALEGMGGSGPSGLVLSRDSLSFSSAPGGSAHAQVISIRATNGDALALTATSSAAWASPIHSALTTPARATIRVDPSGLPAGEHLATLAFTSTSGASASVEIALHIGTAPSTAAIGEGCAISSDGVLRVERGALCSLVAPGLSEDASAPDVSWTLPEGASKRGARMTAFFPRRGSFTVKVSEGGAATVLPIQVE